MPRGRGRGGRGGRSGSRRAGGRTGASIARPATEAPPATVDIENNPKQLFTGLATTEQHLEAQKVNRNRYAAALAVLIKNKVQVTQNARIRALAMAWARGDKDFAKSLLQLRSQFGLVEVLRAVTMLDSGRQMRVIERKLKSLQLSQNKVNPKKIGKLKSDIDNLRRLKPSVGSASGAVIRQVTSWVKSFTEEEMEFFAIHYPKEPWKKLADICHLNPSKDFSSTPWFLPYCFDSGNPPDGSLSALCKNLTAETVNSLVKEVNVPYSVLKPHQATLNDESKRLIAERETLDTVLWYYEDLRTNKSSRAEVLNISDQGRKEGAIVTEERTVDDILYKRLKDKDPLTLPNGKLLERLLTILLLKYPEFAGSSYYSQVSNKYEGEKEENFLKLLIEAAEPRLTSIKLSLDSPVVVIGDASPSMAVAIRTSTIIASLLTSICDAQLVFFDSVNRVADFLPKTVTEMLQLAVSTMTQGATAPAASLHPYYINQEVVKTIIVVTDEEENTSFDGHRFAGLYKKYHDEVYPATLVFVSFLHSQHAEGQMVKSLQHLGFTPKQLRLEGSRPDLTRLDDLFAQLSASTTDSFIDQVKEAEQLVKNSGVQTLYDSIQDAKVLTSEE